MTVLLSVLVTLSIAVALFLNNSPTRKSAIIDNVIIREIDSQLMKVIHKSSDISDHHTIISIYYTAPSVEGQNVKMKKKFCDVDRLHQVTSENDLCEIYTIYDVNEKCDRLLSILKSKIDLCSTERNAKKKLRRVDRSWVNQDIVNFSSQKKKLFARHKAHPRNPDYEKEYNEFKKQFKVSTRNTNINHRRNRLKTCNGNSKAIWKMINEERGINSHHRDIPKLNIGDGRVENPREVVDLFYSHFDSIGKELIDSQKMLGTQVNPTPFTDHEFVPSPSSSFEVEKIIVHLNSNKASGLDQISVKAAKAPRLVVLFRTSSMLPCFRESFLNH